MLEIFLNSQIPTKIETILLQPRKLYSHEETYIDYNIHRLRVDHDLVSVSTVLM